MTGERCADEFSCDRAQPLRPWRAPRRSEPERPEALAVVAVRPFRAAAAGVGGGAEQVRGGPAARRLSRRVADGTADEAPTYAGRGGRTDDDGQTGRRAARFNQEVPAPGHPRG